MNPTLTRNALSDHETATGLLNKPVEEDAATAITVTESIGNTRKEDNKVVYSKICKSFNVLYTNTYDTFALDKITYNNLLNMISKDNLLISNKTLYLGSFFKMLIISSAFYIANYLAIRLTYRQRYAFTYKVDPKTKRNILENGQKIIIKNAEGIPKLRHIPINVQDSIKDLLKEVYPRKKTTLFSILNKIVGNPKKPNQSAFIDWIETLHDVKKINPQTTNFINSFPTILTNLVKYIGEKDGNFDMSKDDNKTLYNENKVVKILFRPNLFISSKIASDKLLDGKIDTSTLTSKLDFINGKFPNTFDVQKALNVWNSYTYSDSVFCETFGCSITDANIWNGVNPYGLTPNAQNKFSLADKTLIATIISKSGVPITNGDNGLNLLFNTYINEFSKGDPLSLNNLQEVLVDMLITKYKQTSHNATMLAFSTIYRVTYWMSTNVYDLQNFPKGKIDHFYSKTDNNWNDIISDAAFEVVTK